MNSHFSNHMKFGLSWERFLPDQVSIPLTCWLKCAFCNVEETYQSTVLVLTEYDPQIGFLTSEGYPYSYPRNTVSVSAGYPIPEGWYMNIYFQDFDVEESKHCL